MAAQVSEDEVISLFYEGALDASKWREGLAKFATYAGARSAISLRHDIRHSGAVVLDNCGQDPAAIRAYEAHYHNVDPLSAHWRAHRPPIGTWLNDWELFGSKGFARSEYYNDFMLKHETHAVLANIALQTNDCVASVSVQRAPGQESFTARDVERLARVSSHLRRAARMYFDTAAIRERGALASAVLSQIGLPVLVVGVDGHLLLASSAAEKHLRSETHLRMSGTGQLRATRSEHELSRSIRSATCTLPSGSYLQLIGAGSAPPLTICVTPLSPHSDLARPWERPVATILLAHAGAPAELETILRSVHGLTSAEARVAVSVAAGYSPAEISEWAGTSVWTVRTQLRSIFDKLGVSRQSELASLVSRLSTLAR